MGRNNQQRRAAKKRKRRRRRQARTGNRGPRRDPTAGARSQVPPRPEDLLWEAVRLWGSDDQRDARLLDELSAHADEAAPLLEDALAEALDALWGRGWAPVDLVQATSRQLSDDHGDLAAMLAVADGRSRRREGQRLHPRWEAQLAGLAERGTADTSATHDGERLRLGVQILCLLLRLGEVPPTVPAPGAAAEAANGSRGLDERVLARVRALLAKAESTPFDEEAEALTAKAQELIARHAVDEALLHSADEVGAPAVRRIPVDPPYEKAKAGLLTEVGDANRCRVVHSAGCGWVTVFGYDGDLDAVELLAASLLAQATAAMARHGPQRDASGRSRTRSFRRSFLLGFAYRIGQRLRETTDAQVAAADADRLLPVLAARDDRLDAAVAEAFPQLEQQSGSVSHTGGFAAGQAAAELADLDVTAGALDDARAS